MERKPNAGVAPAAAQKPKKRKPSSERWLRRHLSDPYVTEARRRGYRSRAAFKLIELDDRHHVLRLGARVIDLGAAPGGWTQVAAERVGLPSSAGGARAGQVVALDIEPMDPVPGARVLCGDFLDETMAARLQDVLEGPVDVVLSDMAPSATGHAGADHLRIMGLAEAAFAFATAVLAADGAFVCKVFQGGTEAALLAEIKRRFERVRHAKPRSSRPESAETYLVATGFRGRQPQPR